MPVFFDYSVRPLPPASQPRRAAKSPSLIVEAFAFLSGSLLYILLYYRMLSALIVSSHTGVIQLIDSKLTKIISCTEIFSVLIDNDCADNINPLTTARTANMIEDAIIGRLD